MPDTNYTYGLQPLHVRRIRIPQATRNAVTARYTHPMPADADYYDAQDQRDADAYATARMLMDAELCLPQTGGPRFTWLTLPFNPGFPVTCPLMRLRR